MRNLSEVFEKLNLLNKVKEKNFEKFYINFKQFKEFAIKVRDKKITNKDEISEENIKNKAKTLLFDCFKYKMSLGSLDLAIYDDNQEKVLFEFKSIDNTNEMIAINDLNKKALWQLVAGALEIYKINNRIVTPNFFIATNGIEWFIFDRHTIVNSFVGKEEFTQYVEGGLFTPQKKEELYSAIKDYIQQYRLQDKIDYYYINILDSSIDEKKIAKAFYIFASPAFMFNKVDINANNTLNNDFYKELLYIMGLEEKDRKIVPLDLNGSFYDQIARKLPKKDDIESALDLLIIWFNRILFLKLFEARLSLFNDNNNDYKLLNINRIPDFASLNNLFFEVLAIPVDKRSNDRFANIPYLNSSLFEKQETMEISSMANDDIKYYSNTVLRDNDKKVGKRTGNATLLEYLFEFLDAYNFGMVLNNKEVDLVSPAVLGLIFEKINGYKDGSHYTPTEITDYMAKESIENIIISKVNSALSKQYSSFESFENDFFERYDEKDKKTVKRIIDELTVCDPAVGSGHFLVSTLNILLFIKWKLFGFGDTSLKQYYDIRLENNDIIYIDKDLQEEFIYRRPNKDTPGQRFQKAIFNAKRYIIEHNLFGVDINSKSVEIARLRLWIELLKNAFYTEESNYEKMETLPNIDINIKVGDSLRAPIADIGTEMYARTSIPHYRELFAQYQNISDKNSKQKIKEEMTEKRNLLKQGIETTYDKLIWTIDFPQILNNDGNLIGFDVVIANPPYGDLLNASEKKLLDKKYTSSTLSDIASPFVERSINLLQDSGILTFIITYAITFNKDFSKTRAIIFNNFESCYIYIFDRDNCRIFKSMTQSVSIIKCFKKGSQKKLGIFVSRMFRETPDIDKIEVSNADNYLLPIGSKYRQVHRLPKIGEKINLEILKKLISNKTKVREILQYGDEKIWIRTSGNYWYNAFHRKPYESSKIKSINVSKLYSDFLILLMNSSLFYFWLRLYGDGRDMNMDILENMPIPDFKTLARFKPLLTKARLSFMKSLFSVFDESQSIFKTSKIKDKIDLLDLILGKYLYKMSFEEIRHIWDYDREVRTGTMLSEPFANLVKEILSIKNQNPEADISTFEAQIDQLVYKLYSLTEEEIKIIEKEIK